LRLWQEALEQYEKVSKINPEYPGLTALVAKVQSEIKNQAACEQARTQIQNGLYEQALSVLVALPQDSAYHPGAVEQIAAAQAMMEQAEKARQEEKINAEQAARQAQDQLVEKDINGAMARYAKGDIKGCLEKLNHVRQHSGQTGADAKSRARGLIQIVNNAQSLYQKGAEALADKREAEAFEKCEKLIDLDRKLVGRKKSFYAGYLSSKVADRYSSRSFEAYQAGDYASAYAESQKALKAMAGHPNALRMKKMLTAKAKQLYREAYVMEDYNRAKAVEKWKDILTMCDPEFEYHQKALQKIGHR
jgi:hypothetical protein